MILRNLIASLLISCAALAADLRPELVVNGRVREMSVAPSGSLWIVTKTGFAYRSDDGGQSWSTVPVTKRQIGENDLFGDTLDRIRWFDAKRGFISGYIGEHQDVVLVTSDGGSTWQRVQLPKRFWVYDAQTTEDGHAWIVGSEGDVLRSDDYAQHWKVLTKPFGESERTMSVWFATPESGVVASIFDGRVAITSNGGEGWAPFESAGRDAIVKNCTDMHAPDKRITTIRIAAERVVIAQCGGVYASPLAAPHAWSRVTAEGKPIIDFDTTVNGTIIGVDSDHVAHAIGPDGTSHPLGMRVEHDAMSVRTSGKRIAILDDTMKAYVFDGAHWFSSRMLASGVATSWPIVTADRGANDVLWGASRFFLYRSDDAGKTWDRLAELPSAADHVALQDDGKLLMWSRHGWVGRFDPATRTISDVPDLKGRDIVGSFRRRDVWLVCGGLQDQTARRVEVAQTFFGGQFAGTSRQGFVAASTDGGRSWQVIDTWPDEGPQALFLSDSNTLTLVSWLCGIRQGKLTIDPLGAKLETILRGEDREKTPYVQQVIALDLRDPSHGHLTGWTHHIGTLGFTTSDGGRTWKPANLKPELSFRLFDGTWTTYSGDGGAWVDSQGALTIRAKDGSFSVIEHRGGRPRALKGSSSPTPAGPAS